MCKYFLISSDQNRAAVRTMTETVATKAEALDLLDLLFLGGALIT